MQQIQAEGNHQYNISAPYQLQHPQNWGEMGIVLALFWFWKQKSQLWWGKKNLITNILLKEIKILNYPRA